MLTSGAQYDEDKTSSHNTQDESDISKTETQSATSGSTNTNEGELSNEQTQSEKSTTITDVGARGKVYTEAEAHASAFGIGGSAKGGFELEGHANFNTETSSETGNRQTVKGSSSESNTRSNSVTTGMDVRNNKRTTNERYDKPDLNKS